MEFDTRAHCYVLITVLMCNFSKYLPFINFWDKLHPKICYSKYLLKFSIKIRCNSVNLEKTRNKMELNFPIIFLTRKFWKIRAFGFNQHIVLIMYRNSRFQLIGATSDFGTRFAQIYINHKMFEKINIKIEISVY